MDKLQFPFPLVDEQHVGNKYFGRRRVGFVGTRKKQGFGEKGLLRDLLDSGNEKFTRAQS
jgi:hypothetical protein